MSIETITVNTSRLGKRFEMRRRKNFGWVWTEWKNKSRTDYQDSTIYVDTEYNTARVEDHYKTTRWSEISFERDTSQFEDIGKVRRMEKIYRFFRKLRMWFTRLCVLDFIVWLICIIFNDIVDIIAEIETINAWLGGILLGSAFLAVVFFITENILYYAGKSVTAKNRLW